MVESTLALQIKQSQIFLAIQLNYCYNTYIKLIKVLANENKKNLRW